MKVIELKAELRMRGLMVSGVKSVLIQRLQDYEDGLRANKDTQNPTVEAATAEGQETEVAGEQHPAKITPEKSAGGSGTVDPAGQSIAISPPPTLPKTSRAKESHMAAATSVAAAAAEAGL